MLCSIKTTIGIRESASLEGGMICGPFKLSTTIMVRYIVQITEISSLDSCQTTERSQSFTGVARRCSLMVPIACIRQSGALSLTFSTQMWRSWRLRTCAVISVDLFRKDPADSVVDLIRSANGRNSFASGRPKSNESLRPMVA